MPTMGNVRSPALCASLSRSQPIRAVSAYAIPMCCRSLQASCQWFRDSSKLRALHSYPNSEAALFRQELAGLAQKDLKLIVVQPVAGLIHFDDAAIGDFLGQRFGFRIFGETLPAPAEQHWTRDSPQNFGRFLQICAVRRKQARVVVELPDDGPIGIPVGSVQGQMLRHFLGQKRVSF